MQALVYYIALPFLYLISLLPFPLLYLLSDFLYLILYGLIGYRKKVVWQNLKNAFPDKSDKELQTIRKRFYHYLCDLFLETFKTLTISKESMLRHMRISAGTDELFNRLADENRSFMLVLGHLGNWEWAGNSFSINGRHQLYVIYHPLANKYFNGLTYRMRTRFGGRLIAMKDTFRAMLANRKELTTTAFIADQTPLPDNAYWTTFLNQDTPVFKGVEVISRKMNVPVVYVCIKRMKRGYYELSAEMLVDNPAATADGEISELHTKRLERDIIAQPEVWLWSHKRWKHKRPVGV